MGQRKQKRRTQKKRCLKKQKWEVFGRRINGTMSAMNGMLSIEGCEMEKEDNCQKDRIWMNDEIRASIDGRK